MQTRAVPVTFLVALVVTASAVLGACGRPAGRAINGDDAPEAFVGQSRLLEVFAEQDGWLVSPVLEAPSLASRVAVWLSTSADATELAVDLQARGWNEDGEPGAWTNVNVTWHEDVQRVGRVDLGGLVDAIEVRVPVSQAERIAGLVYSAVIPEARDPVDTAGGAAGAIEGGAAGTSVHALDISGVEPRSAWNARANAGCSTNTNKDWITVHHSVSALQANGTRADHAAAVRGIQAYHMDGRGYCDMGYHFAATADGTVWEAREARFLGAHTGSHNTNNAGIVFIGCFHPTSDCNGLGGTTPTQAQQNAGGAAIGRIAQHYGITINTNNVIGHRDNPDQTTSCPGDDLHDLLPTLRSIAQGGGAPPPPTSTGKVQGVVWDLSVTTDAGQSEATGARRPGATISVSGGGTTTARAGDSYWSFDLAPGTYTFTASLAGYANASREVQVSSGAALWASIGISPSASALDLTVHAVDVDTGAAIDNATITVTGADPAQTNGSGDVVFNLAAGDVSITASAEGYEPVTIDETLVAGAARTVEIALVSIAVEDPDEELPDDIDEPTGPDGDADPEGNPSGIERVTILPPMEASGGCSSTGAAGAPILGLLALLMRRRR